MKYQNQNLDKLTNNTKFWDFNNKQTKEISNKLKSPKHIYDYITSTLSYNYNQTTKPNKRLGTTKTLEKPYMATCREFTDAFIGLARSNNIPAREIDGYTFTLNKQSYFLQQTEDTLHSWPEFFDKTKNKWHQIDPTWENTTGGIDYFSKLDFGHISFVKHGIDDSYPIPAGAYKKNKEDKTIKISIAKTKPKIIKNIIYTNNKIINKSNFAKDVVFDVANRGFRF